MMSSSSRKQLSCGRDFFCVPSLTSALEKGGKCGFDFVSIPLVHPRYKRDYILSDGSHVRDSVPEPLTRNDTILPSGEWMTLVVGKVSPWIQLDSRDVTVRKNSEEAFKDELMLSTHLNIPVVLISLSSGECVNLSRCLLTHCGQMKGNQGFWLCVPITDQGNTLESSSPYELKDSWKWWDKLRTLCDNDRKLSIALEIGHAVPSNAVCNRWLGEPVRALVISTDLFIINRRGFPVLRRCHQNLLHQFLKLEVQFILRGANQSLHGLQSYHQYLDHLYQNRITPDNMDVFAKGYNDYLQNPLQPLMDNLDCHTYEVFEKDPVKYAEYERAVAMALSEKLEKTDSSTREENVEIVIMVVGAGRGPLVEASLKAANKTKAIVKIYAVEKNPGAVVTLRNRQKDEWGNVVTVVSCDMREWKAAEKADILVSELLGSFGDNELSPECLDGAQRFLKADGVSIPSVYNSFLVPLCAPKLYSSIEDCKERDKKHPLAHYETPYVVRLWNAHMISNSQKCFTFCHPKNDKDNNRYSCLQFTNGEVPVVIHGLAGYFDSILYGPVTLSIVPDTETQGMISWFPIFFPFKRPVHVNSHATIEVHIWRCSNLRKVWYEWALTLPEATDIHNAGGRSYWIGL